MVWGLDDASHEIVGTTFDPAAARVGNEELENWLLRLLAPKIIFRFYTLKVDDKPIVLLEIGAAFRHPVQFRGKEYIRIGSYKKNLKGFPEKERELWRVFDRIPFEKEIAADFRALSRKAVRVVFYRNESRVETIREQEGGKGYANGFAGLIDFITNLLPSNEVIGQALRKQVPMFPELAIRELIANAIIHQDFHLTGTGPMVDIFSNRMEITNPGLPLVNTDRFLDSPPRSRNEALASFMRRIGICEERGSGVDKVVFQTEFYQLPAPLFETIDEHTRAVLFAHRDFKDMDRGDRMRACYLHACLRYVQRDYMTNTTLRERFAVDKKNSSMVSRIIKDSMEAGLIRLHDESAGSRDRKYLPSWA